MYRVHGLSQPKTPHSLVAQRYAVLMTEIILDGREMQTTQDCLEQIFRATRGLMPDYGGRNLDALNDDLRETVRTAHDPLAPQRGCSDIPVWLVRSRCLGSDRTGAAGSRRHVDTRVDRSARRVANG